jgi:sugar lactone lactonase YvrE
MLAVILSTVALFGSRCAEAGTDYIGNSLTVTNGGPGGPPPLVILGEYGPAGPLPTGSPATTLPGGVVQDVKFYGQNYNFTLYALSRVTNGPNAHEQAFRVVASASFSGSALSPGIQTLPVSSFLVNAGDLLAFAGIGPYYSQATNDAVNSDATYEDAAYPGFLTATPPGDPGSEFTVGLNPDPNANYQYISDSFGNQGRTYALGVDVVSAALTIPPLAGGAASVSVQGPVGQSYLIEANAGLNAANWVTLTNLVATNGAGVFIDTTATNLMSRFYRAVLLGTNAPNSIITTVAGDGLAGSYSGDGGYATNAGLRLIYWSGTAADASGNLFIADAYNNVIRKVSTNGIITTVAGNGVGAGGSGAYSGDGGPATNASLWWPFGVTADASGNLFIADSGNCRIRKVSPNGVITTLAGNGTYGYSGDGGPAGSASLNIPQRVALDASGNLFIADMWNNRIRKVSTNGIITTVAGNGTYGYTGNGGFATNAELFFPSAVALDGSGNLFIADAYNNVIRKVTTNGIITAVVAGLNTPGDVAVDASGNLFIADTYDQRILKWSTNGLETTVAGIDSQTGYSGDGGPATNAKLWNPSGVAVDGSGNLFIVDAFNYRIREVTTNGVITTVAGNGVGAGGAGSYSGDGGAATNAGMNEVVGVALDASGNLFVCDFNNNRIREVSTNGVITTVAGNGIKGYSGDGGAATNASLNNPNDVAIDGSGNLFIADWGNQRIRKVNTNGTITLFAGNGANGYTGNGGPATNASLSYPVGVAADASGNLFIADAGNAVIRKVNTNGIITTFAGNGTAGYSGDGGPATSAELNVGAGVAVDASGNLFIADVYNNRVRKVSTNGIITTVAGNGKPGYAGDGGPATAARLWYPYGVGVDALGDLFIAEEFNERVRKVGTNGIITTVAGDGKLGYSGDGGAATSARMWSPARVAADSAGNLFIGDPFNNRVRKVTNAQGPSN